jgi:WD40-like Beta Propeller Repeat.
MNRRFFKAIFIAIAMVSATAGLQAQSSQRRLLAKADSAMLSYDFPAAVAYCQKALEVSDSLSAAKVEEKMLTAQNGVSMMDFVSEPSVVTKRVFPLKDFFLFYPLADNSWRRTPNQLDSLGGDYLYKAVYYPEGADGIYYSAKDEDGIRNIYRTARKDSLWSAPELINEQLTSSSDEIYPMVSPDGKTLTFASKGLYGMGGYDLYQASWNPETKDWDVPVNMGFPYSSPYDDFLFINTADGKYSIFASNRECSRDSVCIYVLEYDVMPVRTSIANVKELRKLAALQPKNDPARIDNDSAVSGNEPDNAGQQRYIDKMKEVRIMRDSISRFDKNLDELRNRFSSAADDEKARLSDEILEKELSLPALNEALKKLTKELQDIEMEFLMNGVVFDAKKLQAQVDKEIVGASSGYAFSKNSYGPAFELQMEKPVQRFDYSFMILPEGRFAENNNIPDGLVYQIQIFTQSRKANVNDIKGLSPVFERFNANSGKRTYSVGVFRSYKDALGNLNKVKNKGFRSAIIVAFMDGKPVSVANARKMESQVRSLYTVKIYPGDGQSLSETTISTIHSLTDKDLLKTVEDGSVIYMVGPFNEKEEATALVMAIKASGESNVSLEEKNPDED